MVLWILAFFGYLFIGYLCVFFLRWAEEKFVSDGLLMLNDDDSLPLLLMINVFWPWFIVLALMAVIGKCAIKFFSKFDIYGTKKK